MTPKRQKANALGDFVFDTLYYDHRSWSDDEIYAEIHRITDFVWNEIAQEWQEIMLPLSEIRALFRTTSDIENELEKHGLKIDAVLRRKINRRLKRALPEQAVKIQEGKSSDYIIDPYFADQLIKELQPISE